MPAIPKAVLITIVSFLLIPVHILNSLIINFKGRKLEKIEDPVFIIGHWRSGTTLLQYMMSKDQQFGYLTYYQAFIPTLVFFGGTLLKRLFSPLIPARRPQDDVKLHSDLPTEEENPLATISRESASLSFYFPRDESFYKKYILFEDTSLGEKKKWKRAYDDFLKQIMIRFPGRRLLIKNPHNTGRVRELLELYPKAQFIYLYRNPYEVYPSTYLMYDKVVKTQYLQRFSKNDTEQKIFYYYKTILRRFFEDRSLVPPGNLIEINYHDMIADPLASIDRIYSTFNLEYSNELKVKLEKFVHAQSEYRINKHEIRPDLKVQIREDLAFVFEEHGFTM